MTCGRTWSIGKRNSLLSPESVRLKIELTLESSAEILAKRYLNLESAKLSLKHFEERGLRIKNFDGVGLMQKEGRCRFA